MIFYKFLLLTLCIKIFTGSVNEFSIPLISGGEISLSVYNSKKLMFITLPVNSDSTSNKILHELDSLATVNLSTLTIIAIPSYEDGFLAINREVLNQWYRSKLGNHIIITDGLFTHRSSTTQHPLFGYLTKANQNEVMDSECDSPGYKYFTNISGHLYAMLRPETSLHGNAINKVLQLQN